MLSRATLISLSMAAITGLGFTECGGSTPTEPIPPPPDPLACESLDEQACSARPDCRAQYTDGLCACPAICQIDPNDPNGCLPVPCDCDPPAFAGCVTIGPCEGLDEATCQGTQGCSWIWSFNDSQPEPGSSGDARIALPPDCACAACDAASPTECPPCDCPPPHYGICVPADPCQGLAEDQCVSTAGCEPIYGQSRCGGEAPDPNGNGSGATAPCLPEDPNCFRCEPGPAEYLGCQVSGPECPPVCDIYCPYGNVIDPNGCELCACNPPPADCYGLDEQSCNANPACQAQYEGRGCETPYCEVGPNGEEVCYPCDPVPVFVGCLPREPEGCQGLDERSCSANPACEARYEYSDCAARPCEVGPDGDTICYPCDPAAVFVGCFDRQPTGCESLDEATCSATPECEARYEGRGCETPYCEMGPNGEEVCYPCDPVLVFVGCFPRETKVECWSDADCPNGYCAYADGSGFRAPCEGEGCDAPAPPPPGGICLYPNCDDGQPILCDAIEPRCAPGEVAAARNGCWACVDARSCGETPPPPPVCADEPVSCFALPPTACPAGTELGVKNGCWACVEPSTCQEVVCHDGSEIICRAIPPTCAPDQGLAIVNACWACVDPTTCQ